jgi:hypothetical protein
MIERIGFRRIASPSMTSVMSFGLIISFRPMETGFSWWKIPRLEDNGI